MKVILLLILHYLSEGAAQKNQLLGLSKQNAKNQSQEQSHYQKAKELLQFLDQHGIGTTDTKKIILKAKL